MNEKIQGMIKAIRDWADEKFQPKGDYAAESDIPTLTSQLTNDSGFVTNIVDNLVNYYKKSETYTKNEVAALIAGINTMQFLVVAVLPTENISTSTIYLVPAKDGEIGNVYNEYLYVNRQWEVIGNTEIDLSGYLTTTGDSSATVSSGDIEAGDSIDIVFDEEDYPVLIINSTEKLRVKFKKISDCFNELVSTIKSKITSQNDDFANSLAQINSDLQRNGYNKTAYCTFIKCDDGRWMSSPIPLLNADLYKISYPENIKNLAAKNPVVISATYFTSEKRKDCFFVTTDNKDVAGYIFDSVKPNVMWEITYNALIS